MIANKSYPLFLPLMRMRLKNLKLALPLLILTGFYACRQKASEPMYLLIEPFRVSTNQVTQGTSLQTISEAILYIDEKPAGVYHLPAKVALTMTGVHNIKVAPAIIENAIASNPRFAYTFMNPYDTTINMSGGSIMLNPRLDYRTSTKFELIEDFENPVLLFQKTSYNNDTLLRDSNDINGLEPGGHYGFSPVQNGHTLEYATKNEYDLPSASISSTFLEIHYKTELPLVIGIYSLEPQVINKVPVVVLNPKDTWTKAYINLSTDVSERPPGTRFKIFFGSLNTSGSTKNVFIDNIKLIHFE